MDPIVSVAAEPNKASNPGTPSRENRFSFLKGEGERMLHRQSMSEEKCETLAFSAARQPVEDEELLECPLEPYLAPIQQEASPKEDITEEEIDPHLGEQQDVNKEIEEELVNESPIEVAQSSENQEEAQEEVKEFPLNEEEKETFVPHQQPEIQDDSPYKHEAMEVEQESPAEEQHPTLNDAQESPTNSEEK